jgi:hypothetical protein
VLSEPAKTGLQHSSTSIRVTAPNATCKYLELPRLAGRITLILDAGYGFIVLFLVLWLFQLFEKAFQALFK